MPPKPWKTLSSREVCQNPWMRGRDDMAEMSSGKTVIAVLHAERLHLGR
jgi:hypothetical protein